MAVLEGIVRLLSATPDAAGIVWRWDLDEPAVWVPMDRVRIEQALLNIVKNAVEAIDGEGAITLRVTSRAGRPALVVEDSGPGISSGAMANLFTPFFSSKPHGQGIGLTLAQDILAGHGFDYTRERTPQDTTRFSGLMR